MNRYRYPQRGRGRLEYDVCRFDVLAKKPPSRHDFKRGVRHEVTSFFYGDVFRHVEHEKKLLLPGGFGLVKSFCLVVQKSG